MNKTKITKLLLAALPLFGGLLATGCDSKDNKDDDDEVILIDNTSVVGVSSFTLSADSKVMGSLDSVFFSVDLNNRVIFNADSLPKGTKVNKLVPVIKFMGLPSSVVLKMTGGSTRTGEVNYLTSSTDSIDFTGRVTLDVTAADGVTKTTYLLKVNVHRSVGDTIVWENTSTALLPSRLSDPKQQKTVAHNGTAFCFLQESDGSYTLASTRSPKADAWNKNSVSLAFTPQVRTFTATGGDFYMLGSDGTLYSSPDAETWTSTGEIWESILGAFGSDAMGLKTSGASILQCTYPGGAAMTAASDFPVKGFSPLCSIVTEWTPDPIVFLVGGTTASGVTSAATWAYDGQNWAKISEAPAPALQNATVTQYSIFRKKGLRYVEYKIWLLLGGTINGDLNRGVYMSYDNGVHWQSCPALPDLPKKMSGWSEADLITLPADMEAKISDAWTRVDYVIDGDDILWQCPYLYLFGGYGTDGTTLNNQVWSGVLNRLRYTPIF